MDVALDGFDRCCNVCYNRMSVKQFTQDRRIKKPYQENSKYFCEFSL